MKAQGKSDKKIADALTARALQKATEIEAEDARRAAKNRAFGWDRHKPLPMPKTEYTEDGVRHYLYNRRKYNQRKKRSGK